MISRKVRIEIALLVEFMTGICTIHFGSINPWYALLSIIAGSTIAGLLISEEL